MAQIFQAMLLGPVMSVGSSKKMSGVTSYPNKKDLAFVSELLAAGKITPVIDTCYPLGQAADAFRYLGAGHAKGKVIITIGEQA
jgi:NADPH:quinone reductase-like Zn-dependent oxidoreductase